MAGRITETLLSYVCLTGPLITNPVGDLERAVNKLRQKYRTYIVEYDVEDGAVMLPNLFGVDFGDQITRFATLTDQKNNKFDVLVERINGNIFFSKGWKALRDFYGLRLGAWISLVFVGGGQFAMVLKDRFGKVIKAPVFNPPMHFVIDRTNVQPSFNNTLPPFTGNLTYRHSNTNMHIDHVRNLTEYDVTSGFLMLLYKGFYENVLDKDSTSVKLVDDCGNSWECILIFGTEPYEHCRVGGEWKRFIDARKIVEGCRIRLGAPVPGNNATIYVQVYNN